MDLSLEMQGTPRTYQVPPLCNKSMFSQLSRSCWLWSTVPALVHLHLMVPAYTKTTCPGLSPSKSRGLVRIRSLAICVPALPPSRKGVELRILIGSGTVVPGRPRNLTRKSAVSGSRLHPSVIIVKCGAPDNEWNQVAIV